MLVNQNIARQRIANFLQWVDFNGCWSDDYNDGQTEETQPITYEDAIQAFFWFLNYESYDKVCENIFELSYDESLAYAKEQGFYEETWSKLEEVMHNPQPTPQFYRLING